MQREASKIAVAAIIALVIGGFAGYALCGHDSVPHGGHERSAVENDKELALHQNMRKLWADHVIWTREYIIGAVDGTADLPQATERLLKNQEDIGAAIVPYYGQEAGDQLTALLKEHIMIAVDLVEAAKVNDQTKFKEANDRWSKNASDIAKFLSGANPNWPNDTLVEAMNMHLKTTTDEAVARLTKDYSKDVQAFDAVFDHMMMMSDVLSAGIIKQFPDKF
jgi:hypothetical protein